MPSRSWMLFLGILPILACSQQNRTLSEGELRDRLQTAGLGLEAMESVAIDRADFDRIGRPEQTFAARVSDGEGNSTVITFVHYPKEAQAQKADEARVNGFAVHNWFFLGTSSNYFRDRIREALALPE